MTYTTNRKFEVTQLALDFAPTAVTCGGLNSQVNSIATEASRTDIAMGGV